MFTWGIVVVWDTVEGGLLIVSPRTEFSEM